MMRQDDIRLMIAMTAMSEDQSEMDQKQQFKPSKPTQQFEHF